MGVIAIGTEKRCKTDIIALTFSVVALVLLIVHFLFSNITVKQLIQTKKPMPNHKTTINHSITKQPYNNHFHHKTILERPFGAHGMATERGCHSIERDPDNKKIISLYIFSRLFFFYDTPARPPFKISG